MKIGLLLMVAFLVPESARAIAPSGTPCEWTVMGLLHVNIAPAQSEVVALGNMVPPVAM